MTEKNHGGSVSDLKNLMSRHDKRPWIFFEQGYYGHNYDNLDSVLVAYDLRGLIFNRNIQGKARHSKMIGVHVRRGDKASFAPDIGKYFEAVDFAVHQLHP